MHLSGAHQEFSSNPDPLFNQENLFFRTETGNSEQSNKDCIHPDVLRDLFDGLMEDDGLELVYHLLFNLAAIDPTTASRSYVVGALLADETSTTQREREDAVLKDPKEGEQGSVASLLQKRQCPPFWPHSTKFTTLEIQHSIYSSMSTLIIRPLWKDIYHEEDCLWFLKFVFGCPFFKNLTELHVIKLPIRGSRCFHNPNYHYKHCYNQSDPGMYRNWVWDLVSSEVVRVENLRSMSFSGCNLGDCDIFFLFQPPHSPPLLHQSTGITTDIIGGDSGGSLSSAWQDVDTMMTGTKNTSTPTDTTNTMEATHVRNNTTNTMEATHIRNISPRNITDPSLVHLNISDNPSLSPIILAMLRASPFTSNLKSLDISHCEELTTTVGFEALNRSVEERDPFDPVPAPNNHSVTGLTRCEGGLTCLSRLEYQRNDNHSNGQNNPNSQTHFNDQNTPNPRITDPKISLPIPANNFKNLQRLKLATESGSWRVLDSFITAPFNNTLTILDLSSSSNVFAQRFLFFLTHTEPFVLGKVQHLDLSALGGEMHWLFGAHLVALITFRSNPLQFRSSLHKPPKLPQIAALTKECSNLAQFCEEIEPPIEDYSALTRLKYINLSHNLDLNPSVLLDLIQCHQGFDFVECYGAPDFDIRALFRCAVDNNMVKPAELDGIRAKFGLDLYEGDIDDGYADDYNDEDRLVILGAVGSDLDDDDNYDDEDDDEDEQNDENDQNHNAPEAALPPISPTGRSKIPFGPFMFNMDDDNDL